MTGQNALSYTLDMQLRGVPVTYTYLTDLHENWATGNAFGPGESGYVAQAKAENQAFGVFFADLAAHGITKQNTLFVVTADEGDHFVGGTGTPAGCNGVTVPCTYSNIGEVDANLNGLLATQQGVTTPFDVSADSAPAVYVHGQPARTAPTVRALEQATAKLTAPDLATGKTVKLTRYLADPVEMKLLHMVTGDPARTPSYVMFGNTDFWVTEATRTAPPPARSRTTPRRGTTVTCRPRSTRPGWAWSGRACGTRGSTPPPGPITRTSCRRSWR
jgi:hypothetical protein